MSVKFRPYQAAAANWLYKQKVGTLLAPVGSGKTAIILHVLSALILEFRVRKVLLVAPIAIVKGVWEQECEIWPMLRHLRFSRVVGNPQQRSKALAVEADIYLINYENVTWLLNTQSIAGFDALVCDESTRLRNATSVVFAGKGKRKDKKTGVVHPPVTGLKKVLPQFEFRYLMTGGVKPGDYEGIWPVSYIMDFGASLGHNITAFRRKYYYQYGKEFYQKRIRGKEAEDEIREKVRPFFYRVPRSEVQKYLPRVQQINHIVELPPKARKVYTKLKQDFFANFASGEIITVDSVGVQSGKLQQVCQGVIYDDEGNEVFLHDEKLERLDAILEDLGDENALVLYTYKHDLTRLLAYRRTPVLRSQSKDFNTVMAEWNAGKHQVLYGHPKSMGHGLNLQGGGRHVIFFGLTWSLDLYLQSVGRLRRSGQEAAYVVAHRIACDRTIETALMLPRLTERGQSQQAFQDSFERMRRDLSG